MRCWDRTCLLRLVNKEASWLTYDNVLLEMAVIGEICVDWSKLQVALNSRGFVEFVLTAKIVHFVKSCRERIRPKCIEFDFRSDPLFETPILLVLLLFTYLTS